MNTENKLRIIADSCVWIEFFRCKSELSNRMKELITNNEVVGTGIILAELLQGVKKADEQELIIDIFSKLDYVDITKDIWIEAGILSQQIRSDGKIIPLSDIVLACCARKYQCHIFTVDKHFKDIPDIQLL